jgi:hypothetical protein
VFKAGPGPLSGKFFWRRYRTVENWTGEPFDCRGGICGAIAPSQPPAGKIEFYLELSGASGPVRIGDPPVVVRFKGPVPGSILIPHIAFMFLFMIFSVRIFFSAALGLAHVKHSVPAATLFLFLGGFVFGPLTQSRAFGQAWTGFPFGYDLTDNKTLIMLLFWLAALRASFKNRNPRSWLLAAFAVTAAVYFVPHSMFGSELDYGTGRVVTGK